MEMEMDEFCGERIVRVFSGEIYGLGERWMRKMKMRKVSDGGLV